MVPTFKNSLYSYKNDILCVKLIFLVLKSKVYFSNDYKRSLIHFFKIY